MPGDTVISNVVLLSHHICVYVAIRAARLRERDRGRQRAKGPVHGNHISFIQRTIKTENA